jgi:hypothetical protein
MTRPGADGVDQLRESGGMDCEASTAQETKPSLARGDRVRTHGHRARMLRGTPQPSPPRQRNCREARSIVTKRTLRLFHRTVSARG